MDTVSLATEQFTTSFQAHKKQQPFFALNKGEMRKTLLSCCNRHKKQQIYVFFRIRQNAHTIRKSIKRMIRRESDAASNTNQ